jgi:hypothetical protein
MDDLLLGCTNGCEPENTKEYVRDGLKVAIWGGWEGQVRLGEGGGGGERIGRYRADFRFLAQKCAKKAVLKLKGKSQLLVTA